MVFWKWWLLSTRRAVFLHGQAQLDRATPWGYNIIPDTRCGFKDNNQ